MARGEAVDVHNQQPARPSQGTHDWKRYDLVIDVPEDAVSIRCGLSLSGSGTIWLDGFQFEAVDASVPLTGTRRMPPPRQPVNLAFTDSFDGWLIGGSSPQDYHRGIESTESGSLAAALKSAVAQPRGSIVLEQRVNSYDYRGRTCAYQQPTCGERFPASQALPHVRSCRRRAPERNPGDGRLANV